MIVLRSHRSRFDSGIKPSSSTTARSAPSACPVLLSAARNDKRARFGAITSPGVGDLRTSTGKLFVSAIASIWWRSSLASSPVTLVTIPRHPGLCSGPTRYARSNNPTSADLPFLRPTDKPASRTPSASASRRNLSCQSAMVNLCPASRPSGITSPADHSAIAFAGSTGGSGTGYTVAVAAVRLCLYSRCFSGVTYAKH